MRNQFQGTKKRAKDRKDRTTRNQIANMKCSERIARKENIAFAKTREKVPGKNRYIYIIFMKYS